MKRIYLSLLALLCISSLAMAGGIVTNTNQSAAWVRMPVRDASTDVDAVFYNPASLALLEDGFYIQVNNQTISQSRQIVNKYPNLKNDTYKGDVFVPLLPTAFLVYKKDKWAVFGAFAVVGGGGSANYANGLPSFETMYSDIPSKLTAFGVPTSQYSADITFNGSSAYFGYEAGGAYKINDWLSVAVGFRYNYAVNSYKGHIQNILINPNYPSFGASYTGGLVSAPKFFADAQTTLNAVAGNYSTAAAGLDQIVTNGGGSLPFNNAPVSAAQLQGMTQLLTLAGQNPNNLTVAQADAVMKQASTGYQAKAAAMGANAASTTDKQVDVTQNGSSFTPILGVNLSLLDKKLNIGIKYEMHTSMYVTNKTTIDQSYTKPDKSDALFPDAAKIASDIPALLTIGAQYKALPNLRVHVGGHYYFDRDANYGRTAVDSQGNTQTGNEYFLSSNSFEAALGFEFDLNDKLALSLGYLYASTSPTLAYQTDLSYSLTSHTLGFGGVYKLTPKFNLDLGILYTSYENGSKDITYPGTLPITAKETYYKSNVIGSIGLTYKF